MDSLATTIPNGRLPAETGKLLKDVLQAIRTLEAELQAAALQDGMTEELNGTQKKKKKKKKSGKGASKGESAANGARNGDDMRPPVLYISRNKHWKYISSYHGPWLQLPIELLESLVLLNLEPGTVSSNEPKLSPLPPPSPTPRKIRDRGFGSLSSQSPPDSPQIYASMTVPPLFPTPPPGKAVPPPIDPGVFRNVAAVRKLVDDAAELSVRASSGLSAVALGAMRNSGSSLNLSGSPWSSVQTLGINPMGDFGSSNGGRSTMMSSTRIHRLRVLAVQKLAEAYKADEVAASVMVMQSGTVFDDIAERVLKSDSSNVDARYVHFFHEKIPSSRSSRQLGESTTTAVLDQLIAQNPHHLHYFRTRGIVHCFRDEYALAVKDFTHVLKESRTARRARTAHNSYGFSADNQPRGKRKKNKVKGRAPPNGTSPCIEGPDGEKIFIHKSVLPDAPDPIEPQVMFHRGAAHLAHAIFLIEEASYKIEGVQKVTSSEMGESRLSYIENGKYGGIEARNPDGPLGKSDGAKGRAYRNVLAESSFREQVMSLLKKGKRDHEKFLAYFDTLEAAVDDSVDDSLPAKVDRAFLLLEAFRPNSRSFDPSTPVPDVVLSFTTYHPLMIESHFSVLICTMLLGDFEWLANNFERTAQLVAGLEGYPVFLPPRSMAQADFTETLERLASGWKYGKTSNSLVVTGKAAMTGSNGVRRAQKSPAVSPLVKLEETDDNDDMQPSAGPSTSSTSVSKTPTQSSGRVTPESSSHDAHEGSREDDLRVSLDCLRVLLAPLVVKQRERAAKAAAEKQLVASTGEKAKPPPLNIPLHGPRVEIMLAWLASVHLPELEAVAS